MPVRPPAHIEDSGRVTVACWLCWWWYNCWCRLFRSRGGGGGGGGVCYQFVYPATCSLKAAVFSTEVSHNVPQFYTGAYRHNWVPTPPSSHTEWPMHHGTLHKPNKIPLLTLDSIPSIKQALLVLLFRDGNLRESLTMRPWAVWYKYSDLDPHSTDCSPSMHPTVTHAATLSHERYPWVAVRIRQHGPNDDVDGTSQDRNFSYLCHRFFAFSLFRFFLFSLSPFRFSARDFAPCCCSCPSTEGLATYKTSTKHKAGMTCAVHMSGLIARRVLWGIGWVF